MVAIRQKEKWRIKVKMYDFVGRDCIKELVEIENESFEFPITHREFTEYLGDGFCICRVARKEKDNKILGFIIYEPYDFRFVISDLAVASSVRRCGIASQMVAELTGKLLSGTRRTRIMVTTRETNLAAQLFLKTQGFRAVGFYRNSYNDEIEYLMTYDLAFISPLKG